MKFIQLAEISTALSLSPFLQVRSTFSPKNIAAQMKGVMKEVTAELSRSDGSLTRWWLSMVRTACR